MKNKKLTAYLQAQKTNDKEDTNLINSLLIKKGATLGLLVGNEAVKITALRDSEVMKRKQLTSYNLFVVTEFSITSKDINTLAGGKVIEYRIPFAQGTFSGKLRDKKATQLMEQVQCFKRVINCLTNFLERKPRYDSTHIGFSFKGYSQYFKIYTFAYYLLV